MDDDPVDADLTRRALARIAVPDFDVQCANSLADATQRLREAQFDLALLDLGLPDSTRADTLVRFRQSCSAELPVVVLTGLADDATALDALDLGAQDYLAKDEATPELLSRSIRYAMQRHHLLGQLKASNDLLEQKNQRLAQLYETAQQFVENVSHEFRTPLTVIREFTSIIRDGLDGPVTPKQVEHLDKVLHRTDDLALMVDDMLDISKLEAGLLGVWRRPGRVDELIDTVHGLVKGRAESKHIQLGLSVAENLPEVFCDEDKARRVIVNLLVNAIKFTPEGGSVNLWAAVGDAADEVTIGVTDSGPGISPENLAIIFERFQQLEQNLRASTKGFGLGLNIAKELVALNLGRIHVESTVGIGSTFSFTLPRNDPQIVFARYLDRLATTSQPAPHLSLFAVEMPTSTVLSATPVADEFLQRSVRANDLVMHCGEGRWIVAALCRAEQGSCLIERLTAEWASFGRNCPNTQLPELRIRHLVTHPLDGDRQELIASFAARAKGQPDVARPSRKVLVVDDDPEVSQCLGVRLQAAGFAVLTARDGEQGIATALDEQPDAVVLDVRMPKKDGLTVLRELRGNPSMKRTPIVMLSASIRDQHRALEAGASYFVPKPYEAKEILSAIHSSLQEEAVP